LPAALRQFFLEPRLFNDRIRSIYLELSLNNVCDPLDVALEVRDYANPTDIRDVC
jgi:hypothetical protein